MATDLNGQSLAIWNNLKPMIDEEIKSQTKGIVQRRKAKVTTAPSLSTGTMGVTEPFGTEYFIPFNTNLTTASVGDFVWVEFMYGATNAFASMYASADTKDWTVGGDANIIGNATINGVLDVTPRRCYANLSSPGWYRVLKIVYGRGGWSFSIDFDITRAYSSTNNEVHSVKLLQTYNAVPLFVNEVSKTNALNVGAIRYTIDSNGVGYVDIRYEDNSANTVAVDFTVHTSPSQQQYFTAESLQWVAPSPIDETMLSVYTFEANTLGQGIGQYSQAITTFTHSPGSSLGDYYATFFPPGVNIKPRNVLSVFTDWADGTNSVIGFTVHGNHNVYVSFADDTPCTVYFTYLK